MDKITSYEEKFLKGFINGIVVIINDEVWGPFLFPDEALAFAIRNFKDDLYKIRSLMDPELLD